MAAPPVTHRQPVLQAQEIPQQRVTPKATTKKKAKKAGAVKAPTNRRLSVAAARSYQPNYGQAQQTSFYANPYQNQYTAYPNYYQGYYNNNWGSSGQACPPGRA
jgi:hypothetical protein